MTKCAAVTLVLCLFVLTLVGRKPPATPVPPSPEISPQDPASGAELTKVEVGLGYIPSVQFAPFYVALDKGYFAEQGLDVHFQHGFETDFLKLVGTGEIPFAVGSGEQVILGRSGPAAGLRSRLVQKVPGRGVCTTRKRPQYAKVFGGTHDRYPRPVRCQPCRMEGALPMEPASTKAR